MRIRNVILIIFLLFLFLSQKAFSQYYKVDTTSKADWLVKELFLKSKNSNLLIKNILYSGEKASKGSFFYESNFQVLPKNGIILSTGNVIDSEGPNRSNASTENYTEGDAEIEYLTNSQSFDAAKIEFDFMSLTDSISFTFVFASEEYPEYVKKGVSDAFAFIITDHKTGIKTNLAKLPGSNIPITVDLVNSENNRNYFINNTHLYYAVRNYTLEEVKFNTEIQSLFQFDGFTKPISIGLRLSPYNLYHFKIVIADVGDRKYDSWVLLKGKSFESCGNLINPSKDDLNEYLLHFATDTIEITEENKEIKLITPVYFDFDSFIIKDSSFDVLDIICSILNGSRYQLKINGFADKVGYTKYNMKLSQLRADSVKDYFISKGIESGRIISIGKGVLPNEDDVYSRKVEFIFE